MANLKLDNKKKLVGVVDYNSEGSDISEEENNNTIQALNKGIDNENFEMHEGKCSKRNVCNDTTEEEEDEMPGVVKRQKYCNS